MTELVCPSCRAHLNLPQEHAGQEVRCPSCQNSFVAPGSAAPVSAGKAVATTPSNQVRAGSRVPRGVRLPELANSESSKGRRHLYVVETLLGVAFLLVIALVVWSNRTGGRSALGDNHDDPEKANTVTLTSANWQKEVVESRVPVIVDFWAPWCGPCRRLSPIIDQVADRYAGKVKVGKVNVDDEKELAARFGVQGIPQISIFYRGDEPRMTMVGLQPEATIAHAVERVLKGASE
jgi:thioredoxin 1